MRNLTNVNGRQSRRLLIQPQVPVSQCAERTPLWLLAARFCTAGSADYRRFLQEKTTGWNKEERSKANVPPLQRQRIHSPEVADSSRSQRSKINVEDSVILAAPESTVVR